jgi:hypothetical protein
VELADARAKPFRWKSNALIQVIHRKSRPAAHETLLDCGGGAGTDVGLYLVQVKPAYKLAPGFWEHLRERPPLARASFFVCIMRLCRERACDGTLPVRRLPRWTVLVGPPCLDHFSDHSSPAAESVRHRRRM